MFADLRPSVKEGFSAVRKKIAQRMNRINEDFEQPRDFQVDRLLTYANRRYFHREPPAGEISSDAKKRDRPIS